MAYNFLLKDLNLNLTQRSIGTDKGLAKIGDGIVNLTYSVAKSMYLTRNNKNNKIRPIISKILQILRRIIRKESVYK